MRRRRILEGLLFSLVSALACGAGCASRPDWIEQTLVTVDVTGQWTGKWVGPTGGGDFRMTLEQTGPKATGNVELIGVADSYNWNGPIAGTVKGDVLSFTRWDTRIQGEVTVAENEMSGSVTFTPVSVSGCCPGREMAGTKTLKLQRQP